MNAIKLSLAILGLVSPILVSTMARADGTASLVCHERPLVQGSGTVKVCEVVRR